MNLKGERVIDWITSHSPMLEDVSAEQRWCFVKFLVRRSDKQLDAIAVQSLSWLREGKDRILNKTRSLTAYPTNIPSLSQERVLKTN